MMGRPSFKRLPEAMTPEHRANAETKAAALRVDMTVGSYARHAC